MPLVFELASFHFPGCQGQIRVFALQRLHTGHFIHTFQTLALLCPFRSVVVGIVNLSDFVVEIRFLGGGQPIAAQYEKKVHRGTRLSKFPNHY